MFEVQNAWLSLLHLNVLCKDALPDGIQDFDGAAYVFALFKNDVQKAAGRIREE